jgi:hypothetical protein
MLGTLRRHDLKVLLTAGDAQSEIAKLAGVSLRPVKRVGKDGDSEPVDDAAERLERGIGRPTRATRRFHGTEVGPVSRPVEI